MFSRVGRKLKEVGLDQMQEIARLKKKDANARTGFGRVKSFFKKGGKNRHSSALNEAHRKKQRINEAMSEAKSEANKKIGGYVAGAAGLTAAGVAGNELYKEKKNKSIQKTASRSDLITAGSGVALGLAGAGGTMYAHRKNKETKKIKKDSGKILQRREKILHRREKEFAKKYVTKTASSKTSKAVFAAGSLIGGYGAGSAIKANRNQKQVKQDVRNKHQKIDDLNKLMEMESKEMKKTASELIGGTDKVASTAFSRYLMKNVNTDKATNAMSTVLNKGKKAGQATISKSDSATLAQSRAAYAQKGGNKLPNYVPAMKGEAKVSQNIMKSSTPAVRIDSKGRNAGVAKLNEQAKQIKANAGHPIPRRKLTPANNTDKPRLVKRQALPKPEQREG